MFSLSRTTKAPSFPDWCNNSSVSSREIRPWYHGYCVAIIVHAMYNSYGDLTLEPSGCKKLETITQHTCNVLSPLISKWWQICEWQLQFLDVSPCPKYKLYFIPTLNNAISSIIQWPFPDDSGASFRWVWLLYKMHKGDFYNRNFRVCAIYIILCS